MATGKWNLTLSHPYMGVSIPITFIYNNIQVSVIATSSQSTYETEWETEMGTAINENDITYEAEDVVIDNKIYRVKAINWTITPVTEDTLSVNVNPASVASGETTATLSITSNTGWTISYNSSEVTIPTTAGTGNSSQTITVLANPNTTSRTINITVTTTNGKSETITITQQAREATYAKFNTKTISTDSNSGTVGGLSVSANTSWTLAVTVGSWLTANTTSGNTGESAISLQKTQNTSTATTRTATVTLYVDGVSVDSCTVNQSAASAYAIFSSEPSSWTEYAAGTISGLVVSANTNWTITIDDNWLSASPTTGTSTTGRSITLTKQEGVQEDYPRTTTVRLKINGVVTDTFELSQQNKPWVYYSTKLQDTDASGGEWGRLYIHSNREGWISYASENWVSPTAHTNDWSKYYTVTKEANTGGTRSVTFSLYWDNQKYDEFTVQQEAGLVPDTFDISASQVSVGSGATNVTLTITSNTSWTLGTNQSWATLSKSSGSGNDTVTLTIEANPDSENSRTVRVSGTGGTETDYVDITQARALICQFRDSVVTVSSNGTSAEIKNYVSSDVNWTISVTQTGNWLTATTSGTGGQSVPVYFTTSQNTTQSVRTATLTLYANGVVMDTCTVTQPVYSAIRAGYNPTLTTTSRTIDYDTTSLYAYLSEGEGYWTVDSKPNWVTSIQESPDWFSTPKQLTIITTQNASTTFERTGYIVFKDSVNGSTATLELIQRPEYRQVTYKLIFNNNTSSLSTNEFNVGVGFSGDTQISQTTGVYTVPPSSDCPYESYLTTYLKSSTSPLKVWVIGDNLPTSSTIRANISGPTTQSGSGVIWDGVSEQFSTSSGNAGDLDNPGTVTINITG